MLNVFIYILIAIGILLIVREILCWYWKINAIVDRLEDIEVKLEEQLKCNISINTSLDYIIENGINVKVVSSLNGNNPDQKI